MIMLWDLKKKKPTSILKEHKNKIYWASFNENGKYIASGGEDSRLIIWDLRKNMPLKIISSKSPIIYSVKWSKCGKFLFCSERGGIVKAFDTVKFEQLDSYGEFNEAERAWSCDMDFREGISNNSSVFVGYESKKCLKVLNFDKQKGKFSLDYEMEAHLAPIRNMNFFGMKNILVTSCRDGSARVWDATKQTGPQKNKCVANLLGHRDNITCSDFVQTKANPSVLATVSWDQSLNIYQIKL